MSAHLIDIIRGALVDDVVKYHSPEWVARARAAVDGQPVQQAAAVTGMIAAVEAMQRAKLLPIWDNDVPHALHVELDIIFKALTAAPVAAPVAMPAASVQPANWKDAFRRCGANPDYHGIIAFTAQQLEHFIRLINTLSTVQPDSGRDAALKSLQRWSIAGVSELESSDFGDILMYEDVEAIFAAHPANVAQVGELSDEQIIEALHSIGVDTYPSKYGFSDVQVSATSVGTIRTVVSILAAAKKGGAA